MRIGGPGHPKRMRMENVQSRQGAASAPNRPPQIWAVGGGKGGVGKSLVASSLGISLARRGHRCALIDLDLGTANLHSLLGGAAPRWTLTDFLEREIKSLADVLAPTPFMNLSLAAGGRASLDAANPTHSRKQKLLRHIRALPYDHVVLDLSAGVTLNTLDFFLAAERRIAVLIPERTSIENTQGFLKAAFFRSLHDVARQEPLKSAIRSVLADRAKPVASARELILRVVQIDREAGRALARRAADYAPMLVINQAGGSRERRVAFEIAAACRHFLAANVRDRGTLPRDERVRDAVAAGRHVLDGYPGAIFSVALEALADDLLAEDAAAAISPARDATTAAAPLPPLDVSAPGAYLRRCRERLGWSLADVARRTRIRSLGRIEDERYEELPPESYLAAFVHQYAQALGIRDAKLLARHYLDRYRTALAES
jgi:flagellar biosynthesis protein FlhG